MNKDLFVGLIFICAGLFSLAGAFFYWDWYMNHRKARLIVKIFGRNGARIFYALLGGVIAFLGVVVTFGFISLS